jgi:hypothetical protein
MANTGTFCPYYQLKFLKNVFAIKAFFFSFLELLSFLVGCPIFWPPKKELIGKNNWML